MPAPIAIESWQGPSLTRGLEDGDWKATRRWTVAYASSQTEALNAVYALGIVPGSTHPDNARMVCQDISCSDGLKLRMVTASYAITAIGGETDPLRYKTLWRWVPSTQTDGTDRDYYDNPIQNSAAVPFDQLGARFQGIGDLTATRNEPFFDPSKMFSIMNRTNSDIFSVRSYGSVKKGQCFIVGMTQETPDYDGKPYTTVNYHFKFKQGREIQGTGEYDSFMDVRLDQCDSGWMSYGGTPMRGRFCNEHGMEIDQVLLDGTGKPLDPTVKVFSLTPDGNLVGGNATSSPVAPDEQVGIVKKEIGGKTVAVFLAFRQFGTYPVLSLSL